jgi:hypothetical protein
MKRDERIRQLVSLYFPDVIRGAQCEVETIQAELRDSGLGHLQSQRKITDDLIGHTWEDVETSYFLTSHLVDELDKAKEANDKSIYARIVAFRNDYAAIFPDELPFVRAAIDEHLPPSHSGLLAPP